MITLPESATPRLRQAVELAAARAGRDGRPPGTEHLLLGLLEEGTGVAATVLARLAFDLAALRDGLVAHLARGEAPPGEGPASDVEAGRALALAEREAAARGHHYLGQEHLLLGLLREPESPTARLLATFDVTYDRAVAACAALFNPPQPR